jgi:hypothetical protein
MKKILAIIFLISAIGLEKTTAQEKTMPKDSSLQRDNMRTGMDNMPIPTMDIVPAKKDNTRVTNMPIKKDTTPMEIDKMRRDNIPNLPLKMKQDTLFKGMYNGQKIRSDTIRTGKKTPNKKELDGTQNGKYNYERDRDSMPNGKYGERMRQQMNAENRGVLLKNGKAMIVRKGKMTVIKAYTYLSFGTRVMSDGTIVQQDGTKTKMQEGEYVNMMGEIVPMKK